MGSVTIVCQDSFDLVEQNWYPYIAISGGQADDSKYITCLAFVQYTVVNRSPLQSFSLTAVAQPWRSKHGRFFRQRHAPWVS